jgi:hypothetical protein
LKREKQAGREGKPGNTENKKMHIKLIFPIASIFIFHTAFATPDFAKLYETDSVLTVHKCADFAITGYGDNPEWQKATWVHLSKIDKEGKDYVSRFKILYSQTGLYVIFDGEDEKISSAYQNDFDSLYNADVFEVFFHPVPSTPAYFEYEISPLNKELLLFILNRKGNLDHFVPWPYTAENKVVKKVMVTGGPMKPWSSIKSWTAELFFPYKLLSPFPNVPPAGGTRWNANFCRLDYDKGTMVKWSWSPIERSFHEFQKYFSLEFE